MSDSEVSAEAAASSGARLESWKEIAAHFRRDVKTVQRWERLEGLPVHRHVHGERATVYAFTAELDEWMARRMPVAGPESPLDQPRLPSAVWLAAVVVALALAATAVWLLAGHEVRRGVVSAPRAGRLLARATSEGRGPRRIPVGGEAFHVAVTPDGAEIYVALMGGALRVLDVASLSVSATLAIGRDPVALKVTPDGRSILVADRLGSIDLIRRATRLIRRFEVGGPIADIAVTPDGHSLYLAMLRSGLLRLDLATGDLVNVPTVVCPAAVAVSPDGLRLFVDYQCGGPAGRRGHDSVDVLALPAGGLLATIAGLPNVGRALALTPSGHELWLDAGDACRNPSYDHAGCPRVPASVVHVLRGADGTLLRSLPLPAGDLVRGLAFTPDGTRAVIGGTERLHVVDTRSLVEVESMALDCGTPAPSPDGRTLYVPVPSEQALLVLEAAPDRPAARGRVASWPGDGASGASGGGPEGQLEGGAGYAPGRIGQAFQLDGRGAHVEIPAFDYPSARGPFSVSLWLLVGAPAPAERPILDRMSDASDRDGWRLSIGPDGRLVFCLGAPTGSCEAGSGTAVRSADRVEHGAWAHVAVVRSARTIALYLDGRLAGTTSLGEFQDSGRATLRIGARHGRTVPSLAGLIDEVEIYDHALEGEEVRRLAAAAATASPSGQPDR